jgi:hypothetical protein
MIRDLNRRYEVWKVWTSKDRMLVATFSTRNEAERMEKLLLTSEYRDWVTEILTVTPEAKP